VSWGILTVHVARFAEGWRGWHLSPELWAKWRASVSRRLVLGAPRTVLLFFFEIFFIWIKKLVTRDWDVIFGSDGESWGKARKTRYSFVWQMVLRHVLLSVIMIYGLRFLRPLELSQLIPMTGLLCLITKLPRTLDRFVNALAWLNRTKIYLSSLSEWAWDMIPRSIFFEIKRKINSTEDTCSWKINGKRKLFLKY